MRPVANNRSFWTAAALGLAALAGACFNPPAAAVQFTCDPAGAGACPAGYTCQSDGCCHRDGSDVAAHAGECMLGGGATGGPMNGATSTGATATGDASSDASTDPTGGASSTAGTSDDTAGTSGGTSGDATGGATENSTGAQTTGAT